MFRDTSLITESVDAASRFGVAWCSALTQVRMADAHPARVGHSVAAGCLPMQKGL